MTVSSAVQKVTYSGNSVTVAFSFPYLFFVNADLSVVLTTVDGVEHTKTIITDYNVAGAANPAGGTVTMVVAPATGEKLTLIRTVPYTSDYDPQDNDPLSAPSLERQIDRNVMMAQQLAEGYARSVHFPRSDSTARNAALPAATLRANKYMSFDVNGDVSVVDTIGTWKATWVTATGYAVGDIVVDGATGANTGNLYRCAVAHTSGTWATDLAAVDWVLIIDVASVAASEAAAAASASTATTQAGISTTQAGNASASAMAAGNSATSASGSATTATTQAGVATTQAGTATTQAGIATTQAGNASASAAAADASATSASGSATTATTQAGNASASAAAAIVAKITWTGAWSGATTYAVHDAVALSGTSYICTSAHTNHTPPNASYWDVLASKGDAGAGTGDMLKSDNLSGLADYPTARSNMGLGSAAVLNSSAFCQVSNNLSDVTAATARTNLGLTIGTNVLAPNGDGSALTNLPGLTVVSIQTFTANGTYTPTSGVKYAIVEVQGGGGSGGSRATTGGGGGGGGGGYARKIVSAATIGASQTITIGAGGAAATGGNNAGNTGGTTSFGAVVSATGGTGGDANSNPGGGGSGSGGNVNITGAGGAFGNTTAIFIGGGGGAVLGPGTQSLYLVNSASAGGGYGGGGTGGGNSSASGVGAPGICIVTEFI